MSTADPFSFIIIYFMLKIPTEINGKPEGMYLSSLDVMYGASSIQRENCV